MKVGWIHRSIPPTKYFYATTTKKNQNEMRGKVYRMHLSRLEFYSLSILPSHLVAHLDQVIRQLLDRTHGRAGLGRLADLNHHY